MRNQKPLYKLSSIISGILLALGIIFLVMSYKEVSTFLCILAVTIAFVPNLLNKEKIGYVCVIFGLIIIVLSLFY